MENILLVVVSELFWQAATPTLPRILGGDENDGLFEWVQIETETDAESEPVCTMFDIGLAVCWTKASSCPACLSTGLQRS